MADTISFARGAPSLDIVDVEGYLRARWEFHATCYRAMTHRRSGGFLLDLN